MVDKIKDYISGQEINAGPEEIEAVQIFSRQLVEDYGYPKANIQTRPQFCVKARPSDTRKEYPVDISVFSSEKHTDDNIQIIVECKKKNRKDGKTQLQDYLTLSKAQIGVWFNGEERLFIRKIVENGGVKFAEIPNIPKYKERLEDIGKFRRQDLKPTENLRATFKAIRNYLAANAIGATDDSVLAQQLINIIFCKIYDEKYSDPDDIVSFHAGIGEDPEVVKARIDKIFKNVKNRYKDVISDPEAITIDAKSVTYIVGELQNYCLLDTRRDVVADAFETFIGHALKGDKGQFFTPRNIVKMIVNILDPDDEDMIIDSACGSGGFLVETLRYVWDKIISEAHKKNWNELLLKEEQQEFAANHVRGLDKDAFLTKITKAYMAILGDGRGGIFCEDSLDEPSNWHNETRAKIALNNFSMILTNPPFGADINVVGEAKLKQYQLGYKWKQNKDTGLYEQTDKLKDKENPQILFIERNLQLLKDGGKLAIVLPETYLHGPSVKYVMKYIERNNNIFAVIDLPHNTFRPHCNAKCCVLFIQKNVPQQDVITMGIVEEMGHNHQGKPIYRFDEKSCKVTDEIWDDTDAVIQEFKHPNNGNNKYVFNINKSEITNSIYVPRYYWKKNIETLQEDAANSNKQLVSIKQLLEEHIIEQYKGHGAPPSEYKGTGTIPYVRAGDIMDWDIFKNPTSAIPQEIYDHQVSKSKLQLQPEDILFVKEGSYRVGDVALLAPQDTGIFLNHHTLVFRIKQKDNKYGIDSYYLLYLLSHHLTKRQLKNKVLIDTTLPNIGDRWKELLLPIHKNSMERESIKKKLREAFSAKWETQKNFEDIKGSLQ